MKYTGIITTAFIAMFFAYIVISLIAVGCWMYSLIFIPVIPFLVMAFEQEINELKKIKGGKYAKLHQRHQKE